MWGGFSACNPNIHRGFAVRWVDQAARSDDSIPGKMMTEGQGCFLKELADGPFRSEQEGYPNNGDARR
jgi:hypothetical protein